MARVEIRIAGHCGNFAAMARREDPWRWIAFPASFGIVVPRGGTPVLFDTGYSRHVLPAMRRFPFGLYRRALPIAEGPDAVDLVRETGIDPGEVSLVVVSHFHPDHIGGLRDFPNARFVSTRRAWRAVRGRTGFAALRLGFLADLLPPDFERRTIFAEDLPSAGTTPGARLLRAGDEHLILLPLEGHVAGQLGLVVERDDGAPILFAADAIWRRSALRDGVAPHPLAMLVHHDRKAYAATVAMLAGMVRDRPGLRVVPSHDPGEAA